jgi:hypothetical protein
LIRRPLLILLIRRPLLILLPWRRSLLVLLVGRALLVALIARRSLLHLTLSLAHLGASFAHLLTELVLLIARQYAHELPSQLAIRVTIARASLRMSLRVLTDD